MILIQGKRRTVRRVRWDHSRISVLPSAKGEEIIIAPRRERVGTSDPENLARAMELKTKLRKLAGKMVEPRELNMESFLPESAAKPLPAAPPQGLSYAPEKIACEEIEADDYNAPRLHEIAPMTVEISGPEYVMEVAAERAKLRRIKPLDFADLAQ